jgi:hypothetical protein
MLQLLVDDTCSIDVNFSGHPIKLSDKDTKLTTGVKLGTIVKVILLFLSSSSKIVFESFGVFTLESMSVAENFV